MRKLYKANDDGAKLVFPAVAPFTMGAAGSLIAVLACVVFFVVAAGNNGFAAAAAETNATPPVTEPGTPSAVAPIPPPRFSIIVPVSAVPHEVNGRLILILSPDAIGSDGDLRERLDDVPSSRKGATFGLDADGVDAKGKTFTLDTGSGNIAMFPSQIAYKLTPGSYWVQAAFAWNPDQRSPDAPGNLYSKIRKITLPVSDDAPISLTLSERGGEEKPPKETYTHRWIKLPSPLLSHFYKRPEYLRAGVVLPPEWKDDPQKRFALCVRIGGFHTRYTSAARLRPHAGIVQVMLDGEGPFGDPYQVNSSVSGPFGDAVIKELLPAIEAQYRCGGAADKRFTTGGSTGGWVSLALQIFYPDYFGGCWSGYPDSLDFHTYQNIDLYNDTNAYVAPDGKERISMRDRVSGEMLFSVREECALENVSGFGNSYVTSGGQWGAWNTVFGRPDEKGRAVPLWDPLTGQINHVEAKAAAAGYDVTRFCSKNWKTLGPKLNGKIHLWVGEHDEYFLNGGVHRFESFLKTANPPANARIEYGPLEGHGWEPRSSGKILDEMLAVSRGTTLTNTVPGK
ncbi:MAG: alpha/beta hydrolase-fold protein [Limisphaerales bacterium]